MPSRNDLLRATTIIVMVFVCVCGIDLEPRTNSAQKNIPVKIITSVFPLAEFAREVCGEFGEVEMLISPGAEVHMWQPRPSDITRLSEADLFIYIGKNMEPWLDEILRSVSHTDFMILEAAQELPFFEDEHHHEHDTGGNDPHVWLDFEYDMLMVGKIAEALSELVPEHSAYFLSKAEDCQEKLRRLDQKYKQSLEVCEIRTFIMGGHAAFGYLAKRYNLRQIALYGLNPDSRPTPRQLKEVVDLARKLEVRVIFLEAFVSDELAKVISKEVGVRTLELYPGANLTRSQKRAELGFFDIMEKNLENLKDGLSCK